VFTAPLSATRKHFLSYSDLISVRLKGGNTPNEGFIEIKGSNGTWGGICDDGWDKPDADVVCRMLGYPSAETVYDGSKPFGHGTGSYFVLDDVKCVGTETSVFDCPARDNCGKCGCGSHEWAGVKCNTGE
jgi:deleted-in-malignant-brain-tumors protein 1